MFAWRKQSRPIEKMGNTNFSKIGNNNEISQYYMLIDFVNLLNPSIKTLKVQEFFVSAMLDYVFKHDKKVKNKFGNNGILSLQWKNVIF